jgi:hypothetical protein
MLFPEDMQGKITDVARWMDATRVPLGTEVGHAKGAVRNIIGLARLTGGDMNRVGEILAGCLAQAWRSTGCEHVTGIGMTPLFTEAECGPGQKYSYTEGTPRCRI